MKQFTLDSHMLATFGGVFYPTGYSMVMFPDRDNAEQVGKQLIASDVSADEVYLVPSATILAEIAPTVSHADDPLPSAGTEGATVRAYAKLAREGHTGLLVKTPDAKVVERMMAVVRTVPYSMAQRYRTLVIEDL
ncbi:hypothetical protein QTH89_00440 [Variovorax sp. J22G21]|uniref:hypothetical protein n=1 Tax=Variovorax fucosicus TaxID=3053517 RepID=UPI0025773C21|nr:MULTISPECIES: hypothetical protein [unclassified Variovorax]MDM0041823.1 hypothetical protein [Variovorax sp. J22R193]MDM0056972.1 hypothetical protein [Variovorax sp. J22G47]MDM0059662.1 hypothetical protein [Variovorax sp. J22G21]